MAIALARALAPFVAPALVTAFEWGLLTPLPYLADHFQFWAAGHLAVTGSSPYDRASWVAMAAYGPQPGGIAINTIPQNLGLTRYLWLYPPQTAFAFAPFGALPLEGGIPPLHFVVFAGAVAGVVLAAWVVGLRGARLALALTASVVSQPFVIGVRDGHPIGVVLAGLVAAYVGARDRRAALLAIGVALVSLKPHIALAFAAGLALYLGVCRERRLLGVTAATLVAVTLPAEIVDPFPLAALTAATAERVGLDQSDLAALARDLGGGAALVAAIATVALAAALIAIRLAPSARRGDVAFGALLSLSLVVAPYAHDYDQLLTVPASFVGLTLVRGRRGELPFAALFGVLIAAIPWVLFFWWPLLGQPDRIYQAGAIGALQILSLAGLAVACALGAPSRGGEAREEERDAPYATSRGSA